MIYRTDYHVHTRYSDGKEWPEACIEAAIGKGLSEIGFSDHITLVDQKQQWCMDPDRLPEYAAHITKLKKEFPEIEIRLGVELDYIPGRERQTLEIINGFPFDYVIGAVHYMGDKTVDLGPEFYMGRDIGLIYENYFNLICEAASTGFYDIIAHPDLVRIHRFVPDGDITHLYSMMAGALEIHDVAFELNTNGRNKPIRDFYPDKRYLHLFAEHGVPVCVNSDAHFPERIGQHFDEAYDLLHSSGFTAMAVFRKRERYMIPF